MTGETPGAVGDLFARMPKAELHLHLDGSLRPETALELARERSLDEDMDLAAMRARLVAPERCSDQADLLRRFDLPIAIMQDAEAIERITSELVQDVAADGTRYAEIRWAPALHLEGGLSLRASIEAVVDGMWSGVATTEGRVVVRLIAVALRSHPPIQASWWRALPPSFATPA
jgi:adenosine deaminase